MKQKSSQMRFAPWPVVQAALALALSGLLLARPQAAAQGFAAGLKLCGGSLLPALFPLFVVCGLLGPLAPALGWPLRPLMRLCGIRSPRAPAVLVLGWCGGYAVCAQQIAALRKTGELPPRDAALLLLLGCCSGPGFVVGCIGGQLFGSVALGLLLYGLQLAANLAAAACLVLFLPRQELPAGQGSCQQKSVTFPQAISNAVQSSLTVCGCAVFCRVVGSVLGQGMPDGARPYLNAALEISAGCADFAAAGSVAGVCLCLSLLGASVACPAGGAAAGDGAARAAAGRTGAAFYVFAGAAALVPSAGTGAGGCVHQSGPAGGRYEAYRVGYGAGNCILFVRCTVSTLQNLPKLL